MTDEEAIAAVTVALTGWKPKQGDRVRLVGSGATGEVEAVMYGHLVYVRLDLRRTMAVKFSDVEPL